ncbi:MAG TPA: phosphoglycerate kinase [Gemmataceae bacterium]|jgi:phosphoglycerate kinase|nr:phosphoglycerate kinase [Gemmataceae bacterium]
MAKKTLEDLPVLHGKRVLVRVDFNVPLDAAGNITNDRRIRAALPTLKQILDAGGSVIVMTHLGRPKGDPKKDAPFKLDRVAERLSELLGRPTQKMDEVVGPRVEAAAKAPGKVLLLENLRFQPGEQAGDTTFAAQLACLADVYVNDAFGTCHRADASMVAVPAAMQGKPRVVGKLVAKELQVLDQLLSSPGRPFVAILGGAKVSDKIGFIKSLLKRVDRILVGGAMTYTFMKAQGKGIGNSRAEADKLAVAAELLKLGQDKILLPVDHRVVERLDTADTRVVEGAIPDGWIGVDIGPQTIERYRKEIGTAKTVVWNGPLGKYEDKPFSQGTRNIAEALAAAQAVTVVGGGETAEAVEAFNLAEKMTHVSTGGGAFLEYMEGTPLPALAQIDERKSP